MKKFLSIIIMVALLIVIPTLNVNVQAAGSYFKVVSDNVRPITLTGGHSARLIRMTAQADDTDGSIPALNLGGGAGGFSWTDGTFGGSLDGGSVWGWCGDSVYIDSNHAYTEVTEDSDITITMMGVDLLGGTGTDRVDNTADHDLYFMNNSIAKPAPFVKTWTLTITQAAAATNDALADVYLVLFPCSNSK